MSTQMMTAGIKEMFIVCGCDVYDWCASLTDVSSETDEATFKACGKTMKITNVTGYTLSFETPNELPIDVSECPKTMHLVISGCGGGSCNGGSGSLYANYDSGVMSYAGSYPDSEGFWLHKYTYSVTYVSFDAAPKAFGLKLSNKGCVWSMADDNESCSAGSLDVTVTGSSGTVINMSKDIQGRLVDTAGVDYGHISNFVIPFCDFHISAKLVVAGYEQVIEEDVNGNDQSIEIYADGSVYLEMVGNTEVLVSTNYDGEITEYQLYQDQTLVLAGTGTIKLVTCGLEQLIVGGDAKSIDLSQSCLQSLDAEDVNSDLSVFGGDTLQEFIGGGQSTNGLCGSGVVRLINRGVGGVVDLSCLPYLEYADIGDGPVTRLIPNPNVKELWMDSTSLTDETANLSGFTGLEVLHAEFAALASVDITLMPNLKVLHVNDNPALHTITTGAGHGLQELYMSNTNNTQQHRDAFPLGALPELKVLHWGFAGFDDQIRLVHHPKLEEYYHMGGDLEPFYFTFPDPSLIRSFVVGGGLQAAAINNVMRQILVHGPIDNAVINLSIGNGLATNCGLVLSLRALGNTVIVNGVCS